MNNTITITFCDRGENHIGNQQIGSLAQVGFTCDELIDIHDKLKDKGVDCELHNLREKLQKEYNSGAELDASLLIIRNGVSLFTSIDSLYGELNNLTYDSKAKMYGTVRNKHARHNLCFSDFDQEAEYENGKGTVVSYGRVPYLKEVREKLPDFFGEKSLNLVAEANHYYNTKKCGIGYHGDAERKIVIGLRLGAEMQLCYYWYHMGKRISTRMDFTLTNGDMYLMSEKTTGNDYKKRKIPTLRHAAGCEKYIN